MPGDRKQRPGLRYLATDRLNALIWALPLPRRLASALSLLVYRNPPFPLERLVEVEAALRAAGIRNVLVGGWAADALAGEPLRKHRDVDILVETGELPRARELLSGLGFESWHLDERPGSLGHLEIGSAEARRDSALQVIEVHGAALEGLELTTGSIGGEPVLCLAAAAQLRAQQVKIGHDWTRAQRQRRRQNIAALEAAATSGSPAPRGPGPDPSAH